MFLDRPLDLMTISLSLGSVLAGVKVPSPKGFSIGFGGSAKAIGPSSWTSLDTNVSISSGFASSLMRNALSISEYVLIQVSDDFDLSFLKPG